METMLVDVKIAEKFLPRMIKRFKKAGVMLKGCPKTMKIVTSLTPAKDEDFFVEYLDKTLNIRVVRDLNQAMNHIAKFSSAHTDAIVTRDYDKAMRFLREVDSSSVFVNVSTRFSDGYQFGLGAEMGISTDKIHARGPMGIEELTCLKFIVLGNGQVRE
jgi:glutamate-5-semialdehyde dehydrogenase